MCKECFGSFTSVYKFKRDFQSIEPMTLLRNVSEFLSEAEEPIVIIDHHRCLSLVPESKVELVNNFVRLVDSLQESTASPMSATTPKSQLQTTLNRSSTIPISSPTNITTEIHPSSSFNRASINTNSPISNRFNLVQSKVVITEAVTRATTSGYRKRRLSIETSPESPHPPKEPKIMVTPVLSTPRNRQSVRGRQSVKQQASSPEDEKDECNETERKLTPKEEKLLLKHIQSSKLAVRTYQCSQCHEDCENYKQIRAHILSNHFD